MNGDLPNNGEHNSGVARTAVLRATDRGADRKGPASGRLFLGTLVGFWVLLCASPAAADIVRLKNGAEIRGLVQRDRQQTNGSQVTIQTTTGGTIVVARSEVETIVSRIMKLEEYEDRARDVAHTPEGHWQLAEWCRLKRLTEPRKEQLELLLEVEPENEHAHKALGHYRRDGEWVDRDAEMAARGYVKYKGKYVSQEELAMLEASAAEKAAMKQWSTKVKQWYAGLKSPDPNQFHVARRELMEVKEASAVGPIARIICMDMDPQMRMIGVQAIARIEGPEPGSVLGWHAIFDDSPDVRSQSLQGIAGEKVEAAIPQFRAGLQCEINAVVRNSGRALHRHGNEEVIPDLINALVTAHQVQYTVEDNSNTTSVGIGPNGEQRMLPSNGGNYLMTPELADMLRSGNYPYGVRVVDSGLIAKKPPKWLTKTVLVRNDEVLEALNKITGQNFGFEEEQWHAWWAAKKAGKI